VASKRVQDHTSFRVEEGSEYTLITMTSADGMNRLPLANFLQLGEILARLAQQNPVQPLILTGNEKFFSTGADLAEIRQLTGDTAIQFSRRGQQVTDALDRFPALTIAAIRGYCMGGSMDTAMACDLRICSPDAVFGHRGAALGILTGWGGTQRLPRLVGRARALQMFLAGEVVSAHEALRIGLVNEIAEDPIRTAVEMLRTISREAN
jgi:enoyl-CoA hydratase/carnithine racemase